MTLRAPQEPTRVPRDTSTSIISWERAALADDPEAPATEFVFDVTSDRKLTYAVSVFPAGRIGESMG